MGRDETDEIEKFVKRLKEKVDVEKVIVFGSHARGIILQAGTLT